MSNIRRDHLASLEPDAFERVLQRHHGRYFRIYSSKHKGYWNSRLRAYTSMATQGSVYYLAEAVSLTNHLGIESGIEFVPLAPIQD